MTKVIRNFGIGVVLVCTLALVLGVAGSIASMTGCAKQVDVATAPAPANETDQHKALRATAGFSASLDAVQDVNEKLYAKGLIAKDETKAIAQAIKEATYLNDQATTRIFALGAVDASNRAQVAVWLHDVVDSVRKLDGEGVTHVKNDEARQKLRTALAIADSAIVLSQSFQ